MEFCYDGSRCILCLSLTFLLLAWHAASFPSDWEMLSSNRVESSRVRQLDAGIATSIWALDYLGKPLVKVGLKGQWSTVNDSGISQLRWVSSGAAGVWAVQTFLGVPLYRDGITEQAPGGVRWLPVEGRGFTIIESGLPKCVYALNSKFELYYRDGISESNRMGTLWKQIWGKYKFISAGTYGVWIIDLDNKIYFGKGSSASLSLVNNWQQIDKPDYNPTIRYVVAGFDGSVWALSDDNVVYKRDSVNILSPTGKTNGWTRINGLALGAISAGLPGVIGITVAQDVVVHRDRKCGGLLQESSGTFSTPNYPGLYLHDVVCLWVINVPKAKSIIVTIESFDISDDSGDFLAYSRDGSFQLEQNPVRINGPGRKVLTFQKETAIFEFVSDGRINSKGFLAKYNSDVRQEKPATTQLPATTKPVSGCGGAINKASGSISSPNYPDVYKSNTDCTWFITVPRGQRIRFTVDMMDIEQDTNCRYDYLRIGDGPIKGAESRAVICGTRSYDFISQGNQMWVQFSSDGQFERRGFRAFWSVHSLTTTEKILTKAATTVPITQAATTQRPPTTTAFPECGGNLIQASGSISSPNYPGIYKSNTDCTWFITVPLGQRIRFTVDMMDIEQETNCIYDYLRIGDGPIKGAESRAVICGTRSYDFISQGNQMWVQFFSDSQLERRGFRALWSVHSLTTTEKTLTIKTTSSPFKGWSLLPNSFSLKFLQIDSGMTDRLVALDSNNRPFMRANGAWSAVPSESLLYVTTGDAGTWAIDSRNQVRYFSSSSRRQWDYTGSERFISIDSGPKGFVFAVRSNGILAYRSGISEAVPFGLQWTNFGQSLKSVSVGSYGIWGVDDFGIVHFAMRPSNLEVFPLSWRVISSPFLKMIDAGFSKNVWGIGNNGQVVIRDGVSHDTPFGTKWVPQTGVVLSDVTSGFRGLFGISNARNVLKSDDTSSVCGGFLKAQSGRIFSPGYPLSSYSNAHCLWIIRVPFAQRITLDVSYFNVFKTANCLDDYVLLYKRGHYSPEYGVDKYCGTERDSFSTMTYNTDEVWLQFHAASQQRIDSFYGFDIRYSASVGQITPGPVTPVITTRLLARTTDSKAHSGCGGDFSSNSGAFASPGFPDQYQSSLRCIWRIRIEPSRELTLKFDEFSVEDDSRCQFDYLLIKTSENGRELGRFCGNRSPPDIIVGGNTAWLYFETDDSVNKRGFRMIWSSNLKRGFTAAPTQATTIRTTQQTTKQPTSQATLAPRIPSGWSKAPANIQIAHIDGGISPNAWAVDINDNTYVQDGENWRLTGLSKMTWVTSGGSGVWGVNNAGQVFYRRGVAPLIPKGIDWKEVPLPNGYRIDSGPMGSVLALDKTGNLLLREGITSSIPTGTGWKPVASGYKHMSIGSYGYWAVNDRNEVFFATMVKQIPLISNLRWTRVSGRFTQVKAGFGNSLWAVTPEGDLYFREGITAVTPRGLRWIKEDSVKVNGVTTGMSGVFASMQRTNQLITKPDRVCGDIFTGPSGSFATPRYPSTYPPNTTCLWQIRVPGASKIFVEFDNFQLEEGQRSSLVSCNEDYLLYLQDGEFPSQFGAKKRCGRDLTPIIFDRDKAWIEFVSNGANNFPGFFARYRAVTEPGRITKLPETTTSTTGQPTAVRPKVYTGCGGTIDASSLSSGQFAHPSYPADYSSSQTCSYVIKTGLGKRISLDFALFDLEGTSDCRYDSFEIRDGEAATAPLIGLYCGKLRLKNITSTGNALHMRFKSDSSTQFKGYLGTWKVLMDVSTTTKQAVTAQPTTIRPTVYTGCGGTIDASSLSSGQFAHPSYPADYRSSQTCSYVIKTGLGKRISLDFALFDLEGTSDCRYDSFEIREGEAATAPLIGLYCGKLRLKNITSTGNALHMRFKSDSSTQFKGYLGTWKVLMDVSTTTKKPETTTGSGLEGPKIGEISRGCAAIDAATQLTGYISHANYPNRYSTDVNCIFLINGPPGRKIKLRFDKFALEFHESCKFDYLEVQGIEGAKPTRKFCGTEKPADVISKGSSVTVKFVSDSATTLGGFLIRWNVELENTLPTLSPKTTTAKNDGSPITVCGGTFRSESGLFATPNYPNNYGNNLDCQWHFIVNENKFVELTFEVFDLERSDTTCNYDYVQIFDVVSNREIDLGKYCEKMPNAIKSKGEQLKVLFHSDSDVNRKGFVARWIARDVQRSTASLLSTTKQPCFKTILGVAGEISEGGISSFYQPNRDCTWLITVRSGSIIRLQFAFFSIENSLFCSKDSLRILDGPTEISPTIANLCGEHSNRLFFSSGNQVRIVFKTDGINNARGFKLYWSSQLPLTTKRPTTTTSTAAKTRKPTTLTKDVMAPSCGGRLYGRYGVLRNPKFNSTYPFTITCTWTVEVGPASVIDLQLLAAVFKHDDCKSSLLIKDGVSFNSKQIKMFCKNQTVSSFKSSGNVVYIEHKVEENTNSQFVLSWYEQTENSFKGFNCGGMKTHSPGTISSPNFPLPYPDDVLCTWILLAPKGHKVSMEFLNFNLEQNPDCSKDYLLIRDGYSSSSTAVGRYCGNAKPRNMLSSSNSIWIQLKADCKTPYNGFRMMWKFVKDNMRGTPKPGTAEPGTTLLPTRRKSPRLSTRLPTPMTKPSTPEFSTAQPMTPQKISPTTPSVNAKGGLITGQNGVIQSPNYPRPYPNSADITWVLMGPSAGRISITFRTFSLEEDSACRYDFVELRDGAASSSPFIGKFCGGNLPATYLSADNSLFVKFKSDVSENRLGFQASWKWLPTGVSPAYSKTDRQQSSSACGGVLTGENGEISSPNYPAFYPPNSDCIWVIRPASGRPVQLSFKSFSLEAESRCGYDFVELRDGESRQSTRLGKFCGSTLPNKEFSNRGTLWIRFKSDSSTNDAGFLASWKTVKTKRKRRHIKDDSAEHPVCSFPMSGNNGELQIPRNTHSQDGTHSTFCTWTIKTSTKRRIYLHIRDLGFRKKSNCTANYMEIYKVLDDSYKLISRLCSFGRHLPHITIPTKSRRIFIKYAIEGKQGGFKVEWTTLQKKV